VRYLPPELHNTYDLGVGGGGMAGLIKNRTGQ
jgi:hypothetical protein